MSPRKLPELVRALLGGALVAAVLCSAGSGAAQAATNVRPYDAAAPWNTAIGPAPVVERGYGSFSAVASGFGPLTADSDQYTMPVYEFGGATPRRTVRFDGFFSSYDAGDDSRQSPGFEPTVDGIPIPDGALPSEGSDSQVVLWDPESGVEYGLFELERDAFGNYTATNGYRYHTTAGYHGRFADGKAGRGAGFPYLAGLVRPWEIAQGRIDHALAFAYRTPSNLVVFPASKTDGDAGSDQLPQGARLQLDPTLTEADFARMRLPKMARIIAVAMQRYGMFLVDTSGSTKIYLEDRKSAAWSADVQRDLVSSIGLDRFRKVSGTGSGPVPPEPALAAPCPGLAGSLAARRAGVRSATRGLAKAVAGIRVRHLRSRRGTVVGVPVPDGQAVEVRISVRRNGRTRVLSTGRVKARGCASVRVRLRPTAAGRELLRSGTRVDVRISVPARRNGTIDATHRARLSR